MPTLWKRAGCLLSSNKPLVQVPSSGASIRLEQSLGHPIPRRLACHTHQLKVPTCFHVCFPTTWFSALTLSQHSQPVALRWRWGVPCPASLGGQGLLGKNATSLKAGTPAGIPAMLGQITLCSRGCSMHCEMFRYIHGLDSLDSRSSTPSGWDNQKFPKLCQMSPGTNLLLIESHCFRQTCQLFIKPKQRTRALWFSTFWGLTGNKPLESCQKNQVLCSGDTQSI